MKTRSSLSRILIGIFSSAFFFTLAQAEPFTLISGFDDVLRQANNQNYFKAALKLGEKDRTFVGMPELYSGLVEDVNQNPKFSMISGFTSFFQSRVEEFLDEVKFPNRKVYLRSWILQWSIEKFKIDSLQKVLAGDVSRKFIVIFDNSGPSLEMTKTIPEAFPGRVLNIYLHEVVQRPKVDGAIQYITAFDIALSEYKAGRLKDSWVKKIAEKILSEKDLTAMIPEYAYCPKDYDPCQQPAELMRFSHECMSLRDHVRTLCQSRVSK